MLSSRYSTLKRWVQGGQPLVYISTWRERPERLYSLGRPGGRSCHLLSACSFSYAPRDDRLAAWLCAESAWRESFISTTATLCCKFSFAESGSSFPEKWELRLGTPQLTWVPSAFLLLKYNVLCLIKISTSLTASLNRRPVSYWVPRSSTFWGMEISLPVRLSSATNYCVKGS